MPAVMEAAMLVRSRWFLLNVRQGFSRVHWLPKAESQVEIDNNVVADDIMDADTTHDANNVSDAIANVFRIDSNVQCSRETLVVRWSPVAEMGTVGQLQEWTTKSLVTSASLKHKSILQWCVKEGLDK